MSSWGASGAGMGNDSLSDERCQFFMCNTLIEKRFLDARVYLCQEHALLTWSRVQEMIDQYGDPPKRECTPMSPAEQEREFGAVYFITTGGRIKIGYSADPERRLAQYPPDMEILHVIAGTKKDERSYHRKCAAYLRDGREWFEDCPELRAWIESAVKGKAPAHFTPPKRRAENVTDLIVVHRN